MVRSRFDRPITAVEFQERVAPLVGLPVSRTWRGYGSALFLELGTLHEESSPPSRIWPRGRVSLKGEATVMIQWSWRVERPRSIAFGSWSTDRRMDFGIARLEGHRVEGITVEGRLPELVIALSGGLWVHAFNTAEGQPQWVLFLPDGSSLTVAAGRLVRNTQNAR
jgi:hypothetical protein